MKSVRAADTAPLLGWEACREAGQCWEWGVQRGGVSENSTKKMGMESLSPLLTEQHPATAPAPRLQVN